ncbi:MAG TPA: ABC transporter substrate-binding protein [Thermaerobacter sp.]
MKRRVGWLALLVLVALLAAACGQGGGQESAGSGGNEGAGGSGGGEGGAVELTVLGPWSGPEAEQFMPVLEAAEKELGITINYQTQRAEDLQAVLPAQFEAKQSPGDVIFMWDWWVKENAQHAVDLKDIWEPEAQAFRIPASEADGKVVAVPYALTVKPGFWYRKSFFEKHGLQPPSNWDEFMALLEKISKIEGIKAPIASGDGVGWPLSDVTEHFLIAFGGPQLQRDLIEGKVAWTDPQVRSIFEDRLVPALKYFGDPVEWTQAVDLWWNGEYALYFMGNWITGMVEDPSDLGVFALPGTKGVVASTDYAFVPQYSQHVDEAKKLLAFLISQKGMELRAQQGGKLANRTDVAPEAHPDVDRQVAELVGNAELLPDLDDAIGGDWQRTFWDQLKLLWVQPDAVGDVLQTLQDERK